MTTDTHFLIDHLNLSFRSACGSVENFMERTSDRDAVTCQRCRKSPLFPESAGGAVAVAVEPHRAAVRPHENGVGAGFVATCYSCEFTGERRWSTREAQADRRAHVAESAR